jgi:hypothetical protein
VSNNCGATELKVLLADAAGVMDSFDTFLHYTISIPHWTDTRTTAAYIQYALVVSVCGHETDSRTETAQQQLHRMTETSLMNKVVLLIPTDGQYAVMRSRGNWCHIAQADGNPTMKMS